MNHIGLFEGIGGFSLAARWMGWKTIAWCEWNEFGQQNLKYHFPKAKPHGDITKTDFTIYRGQCDILTGGFPCQPYSQAGKRKGKEDDRHLWPEMLRAIREIQPTWVVGENVRGLTNWNGGLVFDEVQADLEAAGYEVTPFLLPACAVNAPHRRDRIWFVAYSNAARERRNEWEKEIKENATPHTNITPTEHTIPAGRNMLTGTFQQAAPDPNSDGQHRFNSQHEINAGEAGEYALNDIEQVITTDTNCIGQNTERESAGLGWERPCFNFTQINRTDWENFPTQPPVCGGNDGLHGKLDGITFSKWRNESIKAYGNAIVPQVAYQIFKAIQQYEPLPKTHSRPHNGC